MVFEITTHSEKETIAWTNELGAKAEPGTIFALYGELGTGKTIIAKGIAKGLEINEDITSPTFLMLEIYNGRLPLYHFDLYRLDKIEELDELNFEEYWEGDGVSVIEWAEKAGNRIPLGAIKINIESLNAFERKIKIEYPGN